MIQANELRIGNWVELNGNYFKVFSSINHLGVDLDSEKLDKHMMFAGIDAIKPIPLTEEIFLKCDLLKSISSPIYNFINTDYHVYIKDSGEFVFRGLGASIVKVEHLHQLQNLFFALTGKELNINLT